MKDINLKAKEQTFMKATTRVMQCILVFSLIATAADVELYPLTPEQVHHYPPIGTLVTRSTTEIDSSPWFSIGCETIDREYTVYAEYKDYLEPLGIKRARLQAGWKRTEKERGVYSWEWLDEIIFHMDSIGMKPWMMAGYGNGVYNGSKNDSLWFEDPVTREAWTNWLIAMVERYGHIIDEWEVWNEPKHLGLAGTGGFERYVDLIILTSETIKSIQPEAKVWAQMARFNYEIFVEIADTLQSLGKLHLLDGCTDHPYSSEPAGYKWINTNLEEKYGRPFEVFQGETGLPSASGGYGMHGDADNSELKQAKWDSKLLLSCRAVDAASSLFGIIDMHYPKKINYKGIIKTNEDKSVAYLKPAYYAARNIASIFDATVERIPDYWVDDSEGFNVNGGVRFFGYKKKNTDLHLITGWLRRSPVDNADSNTTLPYTTSFEHRFENPVYVDLRTGIIYDIPDSVYSYENGMTEFRDIPLYDSPIIIADGDFLQPSTKSVNPASPSVGARLMQKTSRPTRMSPFTPTGTLPKGLVFYDIRGRVLKSHSMPGTAGTKATVDQILIAAPRQ